MKRMRRISCLKRENRKLRKENKQLHDKHWNECMQISQYAEENRKLRLALLIISNRVSAGKTEKPKKTYAENFLEKLPNTKLRENRPDICRNYCYGDVPGTRCLDIGNCTACWNEVMPDV